MTRIYTRMGDAGDTGLLGGGRVRKSHERVVACGEVDELNALLGVVVAGAEGHDRREVLVTIQRDLLALGARLAALDPDSLASSAKAELGMGQVSQLEAWIDSAEDRLAPLERFVLPGGSRQGGLLHLARTVCRRAERAVVALADREDVEPGILAYLNRLSDLLFSLARQANLDAQVPEEPW
jgi:cob(I)alamin adenosyltransferase